MPVQRTGILLSFLPPAVADRFARLTAPDCARDLPVTVCGHHSGCRIPRGGVPVIDVRFVGALKERKVEFGRHWHVSLPTGAVLMTAGRNPFDAIIAAKDRTGTARASRGEGSTQRLRTTLERSGEPTARPACSFIGSTHSLRGHLFERISPRAGWPEMLSAISNAQPDVLRKRKAQLWVTP